MGEPNQENNVTLATLIRKKTRRGNKAKTSETRARFIDAFEQTYGNISASCEYAGIDRRTYYRWMKSQSRLNLKFQKQVRAIMPVEKLLDVAEARLAEKVAAGDMRAIDLVLRTRGRSRGYGERNCPENFRAMDGLLERTARGFNAWAEDHPSSTVEEKIKWLSRFAEGAQVNMDELSEEVGLRKLLEWRLRAQ